MEGVWPFGAAASASPGGGWGWAWAWACCCCCCCCCCCRRCFCHFRGLSSSSSSFSSFSSSCFVHELVLLKISPVRSLLHLGSLLFLLQPATKERSPPSPTPRLDHSLSTSRIDGLFRVPPIVLGALYIHLPTSSPRSRPKRVVAARCCPPSCILRVCQPLLLHLSQPVCILSRLVRIPTLCTNLPPRGLPFPWKVSVFSRDPSSPILYLLASRPDLVPILFPTQQRLPTHLPSLPHYPPPHSPLLSPSHAPAWGATKKEMTVVGAIALPTASLLCALYE